MSAEHPAHEPAEIDKLKASILEQWQMLPAEEQVALLGEQLQQVIDSEAGSALREVLHTEEDNHHTIYPVTGFSRADLQKQLHFRKAEIEQLEAADMREIAGRLEDHYVELSFWSDLDYAARHVLERKRKLAGRK